MCGIYFSISAGNPALPAPNLKTLLNRRGPDSSRSATHEFTAGTSKDVVHRIVIYSSVLSMRGTVLLPQPVENCFCWNGEAWLLHGSQVVGSDTSKVYQAISDACLETDGYTDIGHRVFAAIAKIEGPFAFVYLDKSSQRIFFGRDRLGRRSLLKKHSDEVFVLSSVGDGENGWEEVDSSSVYVLTLDKARRDSTGWDLQSMRYDEIKHSPQFNLSVPQPDVLPQLNLSSPSVGRLETLLRAAVVKRIDESIMSAAQHTYLQKSRVSVLFSGGLDCSLIARLLHNIIPPDQSIELLNVAFENPRVHSACKTVTEACESCPDRKTGRQSLKELLAICPGRVWSFVAIDIPYGETMQHRPTIKSLIYPHETEMDLSIACALYFAARGDGKLENIDYTSSSGVLFSGLGADELFGGYQRHETGFMSKGYEGLVHELKLDIDRLGKRNLGRDDRVISHWGKEVRYPFLDEDLVDWAVAAPAWEKCGFGMKTDDGTASGGPALGAPKLALRLLARKLGFQDVAAEKKRAIQFGARTAKMEGGKTRGTDVLN